MSAEIRIRKLLPRILSIPKVFWLHYRIFRKSNLGRYAAFRASMHLAMMLVKE